MGVVIPLMRSQCPEEIDGPHSAALAPAVGGGALKIALTYTRLFWDTGDETVTYIGCATSPSESGTQCAIDFMINVWDGGADYFFGMRGDDLWFKKVEMRRNGKSERGHLTQEPRNLTRTLKDQIEACHAEFDRRFARRVADLDGLAEVEMGGLIGYEAPGIGEFDLATISTHWGLGFNWAFPAVA